jgi:hypothetical protein
MPAEQVPVSLSSRERQIIPMFALSTDQIAALIHCPAASVAAQWPLVEGCLADMGIGGDPVCVAALATIAVETAHTFKPLDEFGGPDYFRRMYDIEGERPNVARNLGNLNPGDGVKYHGRGLIQLTGRLNYQREGKMIGVDLVSDPDKAKDPHNAAALFVSFFFDHKIADAASSGNWVQVRKIVNGGQNGLQDFLKCVNALEDALQEKQEKGDNSNAAKA